MQLDATERVWPMRHLACCGSLLVLAAFGRCAAEAPPAARDEVALRNELPVSGPQVSLTPTYGLHCHPGALFVLEGRIRWPGAEEARGACAIRVREGDLLRGPSYDLPLSAGAGLGFRLPIRAPAGAAALKLHLWQDAAGLPQDLFRCSLIDVLKVLPPQSRVVLKCGQAPLTTLTVPRDWFVAAVAPAQMPDADWMYDNVDLAVLGAGAFAEMAAPSEVALRRWVLAGGRVLIAAVDAASKDALSGAIRAGLTPLSPQTSEVESRFEWWAHNAGLREEDVQRDARLQLVFARYRLGHGGGVMFFPFADPGALTQEGIKALSDPALTRARTARPDTRVWSRPFAFFAPGSVSLARRYRVALSAVLGAVCLLAMLAYARGERRRYLAAGMSLGAAALLAALLARTFPLPQVVVSRVQLTEVSADARAARKTEWAFLDGLTDVGPLAVRSAHNATLTALHYDDRDLAVAGTELTLEGGLCLRFRPSSEAPPAPLFQAEQVIEPPQSEAALGDAKFADGEVSVGLPAAWVALLRKEIADRPASAVLALGGRSPRWLTGLQLRDSARLQGAPAAGQMAALSQSCPGLDAAEAQARRKVLEYVLESAASGNRDVLVIFGDTRPEALGDAALVRAEGLARDEGRCFSVWVFEARERTQQPQ